MTLLTSFISNINKKYSSADPIGLAKNFFKDNVNVGEAIVSVLNNTGIAGFKFHVPQREQVKMESEATDHYVADSSVVQDNIILKPVTITLTGLQGEYFYSVNQIEDTIANIKPVLTLVQQFVPKLSAATMQAKLGWAKYQESLNAGTGINAKTNIDAAKTLAQNTSLLQKATLLWNSINGVDLFKLFQDLYKIKSPQTRAFLYLSSLWQAKMCFSVETTWKRYDNMMITSLVPVRDENADITDFTVTFKQIRTTASLVTNLYDKAGRLKQQSASVTDKGVVKGKEVSV